MTQELTPFNSSPLARLGQVANEYAANNALRKYQQKRAANTLRRQKADLKLFSAYLAGAGIVIDPQDFYSKTLAWEGITFGLVEGFVEWMLKEGYAIGSINVRLATIKAYCKIAFKFGVLLPEQYALIKAVEGYSEKEGYNADLKRPVTRVGEKKAAPISLTRKQAERLKHQQPDTPQGRRDALLMCLLLDHGFRCGEVYGLRLSHVNRAEKALVFYREKVYKTQTHTLSHDTFHALERYLEMVKPTDKLLMGSRKGGKMIGGMSRQAITDRVRALGEVIGVADLSAHDCRHYWSTSVVKGGTDVKTLQDAGGWSNPIIPLRYVESNKIANKGVKLG